jgi:hypothetical protein
MNDRVAALLMDAMIHKVALAAEEIIAIIVLRAKDEADAHEGIDKLHGDMKRRLSLHYTKGSA